MSRVNLTRTTPLIAAVTLLALVPPVGVFTEQAGPMTEAKIRSLTRDAAREAKSDLTAVVLGLDRRVRERWSDFETFPVTIVKREELVVLLTTPFMRYRQAVVEQLRTRARLNAVPWIDAVVISVSPERIDAPDIVDIVVACDGARIAPLGSGLRPMTFTNGKGETAVLHAGDVHFPTSAFATATRVTVSAVPATGSPFVLTLQNSQLRELK